MKPEQLMRMRAPLYGRENGFSDHPGAPFSPSSPASSHPRPRPELKVAGRFDRAGPASRIGEAALLDMKEILNFPTPREAQLRTLFGLTPAEARLAQLLASGDTLEEVAEKLGIKLTTARSQLAVIFSKTEIRRQTKLVVILSRIAHLE